FYQNLNDPDAMHVHDNSFVFQDSFQNMWICGFQSAMDKFDPITKTFTHFNTDNGFPADGINISITEDDHENLWIGSFNGLIKFNIPEEKVLAVYTESDGIGHNHIWRGSELRDGQMWFGGQNGMNVFYPDDIKKNPYVPPIVLTKFLQSGHEVNLGTAYERVTDITLDWQSNFFEFQFAALNYTKPEKNQYAYMLEGLDKDWYYSGHKPFGRYAGIPGGTYTLRLKGSNNDGVWNEQGVSIRIHVASPFWQTGWFKVLLAALVIGGAFGGVYWRTHAFEKHQRQLEIQVAERTRELKQA
ncbi:MAG: hypothetical protein GY850_44825, partial [bacterium]|nr:hypothetical protein [bacterium]